MSFESVSAVAGMVTQAVLWPVARLFEPLPGGLAWGWSVLVTGALWRVLTWPFLVRSARARITRQYVAPVITGGRDPRDRDVRAEVASGVRAELDLLGLRSRAATAAGVVQALLVVSIAVWSRTGEAAGGASFYGLPSLAASPVTLGPGGWAWALCLAVAATATGVAVMRAAGVTDRRQRFLTTRISPVVFLSLGLFLPAAMVLPFAGTMVLNLAAALVATRGEEPIVSSSFWERPRGVPEGGAT